MKKKEYKRARKRFRTIFDKWHRPLGLLWWHIEIYYHKKTPKSFKKKNGKVVVARVTARWEYAEATINVNIPAVAQMDDAELENLVVHEMCHILVAEMREKGIKHEERVCSMLSQAFLWTKEGH